MYYSWNTAAAKVTVIVPACVGVVKRSPVMETVQKSDAGHLQPFNHQVAGQSLVFRYDATTICKSLIPREHDVYRSLPSILKPFVPDYRGVVDIPLKDSMATASNHHHNPDSDKENSMSPNPRATQRLLAKVSKSEDREHVYHFILLENLVAGFRHPCILDLKIGTRQHGDDAPEEKVMYQVNKCRSTTSAELGVRLCGMKVYQSTTNEYIQTDKSQGRRMRRHDFHQAVRQFLDNGNELRKDIVPAILARLKRLKSIMEQLPTFRFYSSSLLIVYDGARRDGLAAGASGGGDCDGGTVHCVNGSHRSKVNGQTTFQDVQEQQFSQTNIPRPDAHAVDTLGNWVVSGSENGVSSNGIVKQHGSERVRTGHSEGGVGPPVGNGVDVSDNQSNGDRYQNDASVDDSDRNGAARNDTESERNGARGGGEDAVDSQVKDEELGCEHTFSDSPTSPRLVDVRLVDFAHTTFAGFGQDRVVHEGVDHGCLLGLQTLIGIFSQILQGDV